jgi:hypothetical protein
MGRTLGYEWIPAFAGMTRGAGTRVGLIRGKGVRSESASIGLQQYLDAGRNRADLGALGASRAAVFEDDEGRIVISWCGAYGALRTGLYAGPATGAGVRHGEDGSQDRYPLGVTMRPATTFVCELPMTTMVSMSTSSGRREMRSVRVTCCVGR